MKKFILLSFVAICSTGIFAFPLNATALDSAAKIREIFHHNFPEIKNPTITSVGKYYLVSFSDKVNNSSCRIYYDSNGKVVQTIRNYTAENLTPFIRQKIESKYKGKNIFMVTEVCDENEHYYEVLVQDTKSLWLVHANYDGTLYIQKKYKKSV